MEINDGIISRLAGDMEVPEEELRRFVSRGVVKPFASGEYLFHQYAPRRFFGIILRGRVSLIRGLAGRNVTIACLTEGAMIGETLFIDDLDHSLSGVALEDTDLWIVPKEQIADFRRENPGLFYRMTARAARRLNLRLRETTEQLIHSERNRDPVTGYRLEHDSLGEREVSNAHYFGVQTMRAVENFPFSGIRLSHFVHLVNAFAQIKKAAAQANAELGVLEPEIAGAIAGACDRVLAGELHEHFVVDMVQGGAGTSSNMNANEVIANAALELLGHEKGEYRFCHPNDHVNCSQSTNDVYPTAVKLAIFSATQETVSALGVLKKAFREKAAEFADVLKMGRTENQDAVPMTLGQEFSAYATMIEDGIRRLGRISEDLLVVNMGATAIGTGLNSPPGYAELCTAKLGTISGHKVELAQDLVEATQDAADFAMMSSALKVTAIQISKICNDLRWASSGPRCGLNEINLPPLQPGSSIMPGKVNPVLPEVVNQICYQIIGSDLTVSIAAEASEFELNMAEPIIAYNLLGSLMLLKNAAIVLTTRCVNGITANRERCASYVKNSIGIVTALNPDLGYEASAAIAKEALATGRGVYDLVLEKGLMSRARLDEVLSPEKMANPLTREKSS